MQTRTIIITLLAIGIVLLGLLGFAYLSNERNRPPQESNLITDRDTTTDVESTPTPINDLESIEKDLESIQLNDNEVDQSTAEAEIEIQAIN